MNPLLARLPSSVVLVGLLSGGATAIVASFAPPGSAQTRYEEEIRESEQQLEDYRRQAELARIRVRDYVRKEKGMIERLARIEEALAATRAYVRRLEEEQSALSARMQETALELSWARDELTARRGELANRLRYAYVHGKSRSVEMMLSAHSFADLLQRTAFMTRVMEQDKKLIGLVQAREEDVAAKLDRLGDQQKELDRLHEEKQAEQREFEGLKKTRESDLIAVRDQKEAHKLAVRELELAAERMESVLAELERKRQAELRRADPVLAELDRQDFGRNQGLLPWPVAGEVVTRFGRQEHPKYKTVTMSNGIDVAAPHGAPVQAVGDGAVDLVQWLPGYGETVILNHGRGFYTVYGHLSTVLVRQNDRVVPGQVIGAVGDTGSLKGAILHFEIREKGTARDPLEWLQ